MTNCHGPSKSVSVLHGKLWFLQIASTYYVIALSDLQPSTQHLDKNNNNYSIYLVLLLHQALYEVFYMYYLIKSFQQPYDMVDIISVVI
jgi:hypothetical protein